MTLIILSEDIETRVTTIDRMLKTKIYGVSSHQLYMDNDLKSLLKDFPLDELEEYVNKRKEEENE